MRGDFFFEIWYNFRMRIKLNNLVKTYVSADGLSKVTAVNGVSLDISSNTIFGIIGKSGAGKSSLVRLISMMERPDSGEVFYDSERVDNLDEKSLVSKRHRIGMIFQNFNLFSSRSAGENIAYPMEICGVPKERIKKRVDELLEIVELSDKKNARISSLSGGQKQRVAIARALANNPDILFCDEATSALDPQTTSSILNLIRKIQTQMNLTVVMITHQMEVVRDACSKVAVISDGKVVEEGNVADIFMNPKSAITRDFISHIGSVFEKSEEIGANEENGAIGVSGAGNNSAAGGSENSANGAKSGENEKIVRWSSDGGEYLLIFPSERQSEPVLSQIAKKFDVEFNIRAAGIEKLTESTIGKMIVDFSGSETAEALNFLKEKNIVVKKAGE